MSIEDRLREELGVEAARLVPPPGDLKAVVRTGRRRERVSMTVLGIVMAAAITGPVFLLFPTGSGRTPVMSTPPVSTAAPPPPTIGVPGSGNALPTTTTTVDVTHLPPLVVANQDGVVRLGDSQQTYDLGPIMLAVDDRRGGLILQVGMSASSIMWRPADGGGLVEMIPARADEVLALQEVALIDGRPTVVYTSRRTGSVPEESREFLRLHDLETGDDRPVAQVGGYESGITRVSHAAGRFVLSRVAEGTSWFGAISQDGSPVELAGNPRPDGRSEAPWVGYGDQSPDGASLAYVAGSFQDGTPLELVVVNLATGAEEMRVPVEGADLSTVTRVEWDGEAAIVSLRGATPVVISGGRVIERLELGGTATLAS